MERSSDTMSTEERNTSLERPSPAVSTAAVLVALALTAALVTADLYWGEKFNGSPAYPSILLACWWARSPKILWSLAALLICVTVGCGIIESGDMRSIVHRALAITAIIGTAIVCHFLLGTSDELLRSASVLAQRSEALNQANADLAAREREIASQNEELRSQ